MKAHMLITAVALPLLGACAAPEIKSGAKLPRDEVINASRPPPQDECKAGAHQYLIGKKRSEIPSAPAGATWRVACTTCAVTMDYAPGRLNIFFDEKTQVIKEVKCG